MVAAIAVICAILWAGFAIHTLRNMTITFTLLLAILFFAMRWERLETMAAAVVAAIGFVTFFQATDRGIHRPGSGKLGRHRGIPAPGVRANFSMMRRSGSS
jgi:hypothetical protein